MLKFIETLESTVEMKLRFLISLNFEIYYLSF